MYPVPKIWVVQIFVDEGLVFIIFRVALGVVFSEPVSEVWLDVVLIEVALLLRHLLSFDCLGTQRGQA